MPKQVIELSKEGIKISYLRLLSDSAAGFITILFLFAAYYLPVFGIELNKVGGVNLSTEAKIFIIITLALLASPLGLAINALSWVCLGSVQTWSQKRWFNSKFFVIKAIGQEFGFYGSSEFFGIKTKEDWYMRAQLVKHTLTIYHPEIPDSFEHVRGIRTFFRNVAWLLIVLVLLSPLVRGLLWLTSEISAFGVMAYLITAGISLPLAVGAMFVTSLLGVYYTSQIFAKTYILCVALGAETGFKGDDEKQVKKSIIEVLSKSRKTAGPGEGVDAQKEVIGRTDAE